MKISYNWIQELVSERIPGPKELAEILTMHSFETVIDRESVIDPTITVVKILKLEPHPNADRLRLATITDGVNEITVVCGAPNIAEGQIVPYAPPGSRVYDEHGELFTLTEATIRGVVSPGMLNSVRELGLSDEHGGILLLPEGTKIGSKLVDHIPSDTILDVDVLPDRASDASTHVGIAQEICALMQVSTGSQKDSSEVDSLYMQVTGISPLGELVSEEGERRTSIFNPDVPARVAGIAITHEEVKTYLERLRFVVSPPARGGVGGGGSEDGLTHPTQPPLEKGRGNLWHVSIPVDRVDILGEHNLVDEVVRLHGLDDIPPSDIVSKLTALPVSEKVYWESVARKKLVELGFTETYSYSFEDEKIAAWINADRHPHIELENPMAPELKKLRYSMLPGLIGAMVKSRDEIHRERKGQEQALFEIGRVYHRSDEGVVPGIIERPVIAGIAVGDETSVRETIARIHEAFQIESVDVIPAPEPESTQPAKIIKLAYANEFFGIAYVFNKELLAKMKYRLPVVAFEISFNALLKHAPDIAIPITTIEEMRNTTIDPVQFSELAKYPSVFRDISMLVSPTTSIDEIQSEIKGMGGSLVVDVDLFDEYEGEEESQAPGKHLGLTEKPQVLRRRSLAFHIEYQSKEKTLTDSEIAEIQKKIEHALKKQFEAEIR